MYVYINYPLTIAVHQVGDVLQRLVWEAFFSSQKKGWLIRTGSEPTVTASSLRYVPLEDTFFLCSTTYTKNINWQAVVKTGTAGSVKTGTAGSVKTVTAGSVKTGTAGSVKIGTAG